MRGDNLRNDHRSLEKNLTSTMNSKSCLSRTGLELSMQAVQGPSHAPLAARVRAQAWLQRAQGPALQHSIGADADALPGHFVSKATGALADQSLWLQERGCLPLHLCSEQHWRIFLPPLVTLIQKEICGPKRDKHSSCFKKQVVPGILQ